MALLRKDIKLGFVAGALLLVAGAGYVVFSSFGGSEPALAQAGDDPLTGSAAPVSPEQPQNWPQERPLAGSPAASTADEWNRIYGFNGRAPHVTEPPSRRGPVAAGSVPPDDTSDGAPESPNMNEEYADPQVPLDPVALRQAGIVASASTAPPAPVQRIHSVASGESFSSIAQRYYGEASLYTLIQKANPEVDSRRLKIGQKLIIPERDPAEQVASAQVSSPQPPAPAEPGTHVVAPGETLSIIAEKRLGRAALWRDLYELNRDVIGAEPADLKPGMRLRLPA